MLAAALALLGMVAAAASAAAEKPLPAPQQLSQQGDHGLRKALQDSRQEPSRPPRQLSPSERAELRRQLSEYAWPAARRH